MKKTVQNYLVTQRQNFLSMFTPHFTMFHEHCESQVWFTKIFLERIFWAQSQNKLNYEIVTWVGGEGVWMEQQCIQMKLEIVGKESENSMRIIRSDLRLRRKRTIIWPYKDLW